MTGEAAREFDRIYHAYYDWVLAYAARLVGPDEAEDVAQEVFVKIGRSLAKLADPAKLGSWVYAITLNTVRDTARRRGARAEGRCHPGPASDEEDAPFASLPDRATRTPEEHAMRMEMIACYLDFVQRLPPGYQDVYALSEFEHLSIEEIARRLSLSPGAAKIRLHRARARLNRELRRHCRPYYNDRGELMGEPKGD